MLLHVSAIHFGHLQRATNMIDVYSIYSNSLPCTLYLCVLKCCIEDMLQSYLPSTKSSISELSDFSEHVSDITDISTCVSTAYTIHISVPPDFIAHDSFSPTWDDCHLISTFHLHPHNHGHLTLVTQLLNNSSS
jgi:hypothetical protein